MSYFSRCLRQTSSPSRNEGFESSICYLDESKSFNVRVYVIQLFSKVCLAEHKKLAFTCSLAHEGPLPCRARATALEKGLNAILEPLLAEVEDLLTKGHPKDQGSAIATEDGEDAGVISWRTASLTDLPELVTFACETLAAQGEAYNVGTPASIREATKAMMLVLHAICIAGEKLEARMPSACLLFLPPYALIEAPKYTHRCTGEILLKCACGMRHTREGTRCMGSSTPHSAHDTMGCCSVCSCRYPLRCWRSHP